MAVEQRPRTVSIKLAGDLEWAERQYGEFPKELDPYNEIPIEVEAIRYEIQSLRDFFYRS